MGPKQYGPLPRPARRRAYISSSRRMPHRRRGWVSEMVPTVKDAAPSPGARQRGRIPRPELLRLVESFCASTELTTHRARLVRLVRWLQHDGLSDRRYGQLLAFLDWLQAHPQAHARFRATFGELVSHLRSVSLFAESGIPSDGSLFSEIVRRIVGRVLPSARSELDAARLL